MAGATLVISGMSAGEAQGQRVFGPLTITNTATVEETLSVALSSGANVFTVPTLAVAVMIIPPVNNATSITFKTSLNSSDTGLPLNSLAIPFVYPFPATAPTTLTLTAGASISTATTLVFI